MNRLAVVLLAFACLSVPAAFSQEESGSALELSDEFNLFTWQLLTPNPSLAPGQAAMLRISLTCAEDHFAYLERTSVEIEGHENLPLIVQGYESPPTKSKKDPADPDGPPIEVYSGIVEFAIPIGATSNPAEIDAPLTVRVKHQGCSSSVCYFPFEETFSTTIRIAAGEGKNPFATASVPAPEIAGTETGMLAGLAELGRLGLILAVFLGGLATAFTPCVYPLIPITLGIVGARQTSSRLQAFLLSSAYVLGIAVMYTALGVTFAATGVVFGQLMANPFVVGAVGVILIAFGLSMLGLYDIQLPAALRNRAYGVGGPGYAGAFGMGMVSGVIAAPCTGPALVFILAIVAVGRDILWGGFLLFIFSLGLGSPFLLLGTFSNLLSKAPKAGSWMESVKHLFAVLLFAVALYLCKDAFPFIGGLLRPLPWGLAAGLIIAAIGLGAGGIHRSVMHGAPASRAMACVGVLLLSLGVFISAGSFSVVENTEGHKLPWTTLEGGADDLQAGHDGFLQQAQSQRKPAMIDFTADWCAACKELEAFTFSDPRIAGKLETEYTLLRVDLTKTTPDWLREKYRIFGLPLVVFIDSEGNERTEERVTGYVPPEEFLPRL